MTTIREAISTDYWFSRVVQNMRENGELPNQMLAALKTEVPEMVSVTMERACNLQCAHCIYPASPSSEKASREAHLPELVLRAVAQLRGATSRLLHEGRILRPWHVEILAAARRVRTNLKIGLIDNGTYLKSEAEFQQHKFRLDWLDISIDGPEHIHNTQRRNDSAFRVAIQGLEEARSFVKPMTKGGMVNSLFTTSSLNHAHLTKTADLLFENGLVDQFHIATVSPARPELASMEQLDFRQWWKQCEEVFTRYGRDSQGNQRIFIRLYRHPELVKIGCAVGAKKLFGAIKETAQVAPGEVHFQLSGVPIIYSPLSLWPQETFLIDADGTYRTAYSIGQTLIDLRRGRNDQGEDLGGYSVARLTPDSDLEPLYRRCVDQWWNFKGRKFFEEELAVFDQLRG